MNRVMIQEGYSLPFDGARKGGRKGKHRRTSAAQRRAGKKAGARSRACGKKWRKKSDKYRATHSYRAFQKRVC